MSTEKDATLTKETKIGLGLVLLMLGGAYYHVQKFEQLAVRVEAVGQIKQDVRELRTMHYQHQERVMRELHEIRLEMAGARKEREAR